MSNLRLLCFALLLVTGEALFGQLRQVSGTITGEDESPLVGVTVLRIGTNQGTLTGEDGRFTISATPEDSLRISYYGYTTQFLLVGSQNNVSISMAPETRTTEEVVIVGFGQQQKESVVGAISTARGQDLVSASGGASNLTNALVGQVPGLTTIINSGEPGAEDATLFIRGQSTWNGGGPLVLVDGIERPFNDVDPREVESISVLKDASATAVFGVKGANGVILITTKRGESGKAQISVTGNMTLKQVSRVPKVLDSYDALRLRNQAVAHEVSVNEPSWAFYTPVEELELYRNGGSDLYPNVDWADLVTNPYAWAQQAGVTLSGGTDFVKYFGSLSYNNETDIFNTEDIGQGYDPNFSYERFNFRSNFDFNVTPTTKVKANLSGWYGEKQIPTLGKDGGDDVIWKGLYEMPPDVYPVQFSNGFYGYNTEDNRYPNPYVGLNLDGIERTSRTQIFTDLVVDQDLKFITKGLSFNGRVSFDNSFQTLGPDFIESGVVFMSVRAENPEDTVFILPGGAGNLRNNYNYVRRPYSVDSEGLSNGSINRILTYQTSLNYKRSFGKHNVSGLAMLQRREETPYRFSGLVDQFTSKREDWIGRVTYGYDNRYFAEINSAYNGSQNFVGANRFAFFPSFGAGWVISNEKFFEPLNKTLSYLKLRYSYGRVGSDQGIIRGQYLGGYGSTGAFSQFGYPNIQNLYPIRIEETIANPDIRWETATKQNIGIETTWLRDLLSVNFDYYWEERDGIFMSADQRNIPDFFGADPVAANIGKTRTWGWEFEAILRKYFNNGFNFFTKFNYNFAKDEVVFREDPDLAPDYQKLAGYQIDQTRTQLHNGYVGSWDEMYTTVLGDNNAQRLPGDYRIIDYNADGVIDPDDGVPFGFPSRPQFQGNLTTGFGYKDFSFQIQLVGVHNVSRVVARGEYSLGYSIVFPYHLDESWTPSTAQTAEYPHIRYQTGSPKGNYWVRDASYLRLQSMEIAYDLKLDVFRSIGMRSVRIFVNGNNMYLWTRLDEDRDGGNFQRENYPRIARYNMGATINF